MVFDFVVNSFKNQVITKPYSGLESSTTYSTYLTVSLIARITQWLKLAVGGGNSYLSALYHYTLYYLHMGYRYLEIIWSCQILYTTSTFSVMTS